MGCSSASTLTNVKVQMLLSAVLLRSRLMRVIEVSTEIEIWHRPLLAASSPAAFVEDFNAGNGGIVHNRLEGDVQLALRGWLQVIEGFGKGM